MPTFLTVPNKRFGTGALTGALMAAAMVGGSLLTAGPAQAAVAPQAPTVAKPSPAWPYGTVTSHSGVNKRQYPSTDSSSRGMLPHRSKVGLKCKVRAQNIGGNEIWYLLRDRPVWVAAKYVHNTGYVKWCKDVQRSVANDSEMAESAKG